MRRIKSDAYEFDDREEFDSFLDFVRGRNFRTEKTRKDYLMIPDAFGGYTPNSIIMPAPQIPSSFVIYDERVSDEFDNRTPCGFGFTDDDSNVNHDKPMLDIVKDRLQRVVEEYLGPRASPVDSSTSEQFK